MEVRQGQDNVALARLQLTRLSSNSLRYICLCLPHDTIKSVQDTREGIEYEVMPFHLIVVELAQQPRAHYLDSTEFCP